MIANNEKSVLIFIGTIKEVADCGESMKNHFMLRRFYEIFDHVFEFDTWGAKHHPWRILKLLWYMLHYPKAKIVVSASTYIAYDVFWLLKIVGRKDVYYWVIGGAFPQLIKNKKYNVSLYRDLKGICVESLRMVHDLEELDIRNAIFVPNFKHIDYQPTIDERDYTKVRFVFLSRIHPSKGCSLIVESARSLNEKGYHDRFTVDFYGPIDLIYTDFETSIIGIDNVSYKGFLRLDHEGYDKLANYNMMLFPTFWKGEGFPGIVIDAFIAGVPILASDWNLNPDLIDNTTGIIIPHNNQQALTDAMRHVLDGEIDLRALAKNCYRKAEEYDDRSVLSIKLLRELGILNK